MKNPDEFFMTIAFTTAGQSPCVRRGVGAVLVDPSVPAMLSTGYNGTPMHCEHKTEETCIRKDFASGEYPEVSCCVHAEMNAILLAARRGIGTAGTTLYTTLPPCLGCSKALIQAGVMRVVYPSDVPYPVVAQDLFDQALVTVETIDGFGTVRMVETPRLPEYSKFRHHDNGQLIEVLGQEEDDSVKIRYLTNGKVAYKSMERFQELFEPVE